MGLNKNSTGAGILISNKKVHERSYYSVVLAGNPNVGKSSIFNILTGLNQHTGNWAGKTVANAIGEYSYNDHHVNVIDLPGTYSLLSDSEEEEIARNYLCFNDLDVVVVIADATSLERNLNLFLQISEIADRMILCVNLIDEAEKNGIIINKNLLQEKLGVPVIFTSARKNIGINELKLLIEEKKSCEIENNIVYGTNIENGIKKIVYILKNKERLGITDKKLRWLALRFLEANNSIIKQVLDIYKVSSNSIIEITKIRNDVNKNIKKGSIIDSIVKTIVIKSESISKEVVHQKYEYNKYQKKIDKILVSKVTGIPIMILMLVFILWITITLANYPSSFLAECFSRLEEVIRSSNLYNKMPDILSGILVDGVYVTLTWVVSVMLPPMAIFFPLFTFLEDLGYLPRIAFNLDKCFKKCGTCGKQALSMCMGLGCNAAGVVGTRIINSPREKLIAILTNVFTPCNGRFPMLITISCMFIGGGIIGSAQKGLLSAIVVAAVIIIGVLVTFIISKILSKTIVKGMPSNFILELPPYRKPQIFKVLVRSLLDRTLYVLGRAIIVAAPAGAIIWIFANIFIGDKSVLDYCAMYLEPIAHMIGLDGYILMAFILGLPANEIVMPIILMCYMKNSTMIELDNLIKLKELLVNNNWTILTAINVMILCLMHFPCATTLITIKKETQSVKWTIAAFVIPTLVGMISCFFITQVWRIVA